MKNEASNPVLGGRLYANVREGHVGAPGDRGTDRDSEATGRPGIRRFTCYHEMHDLIHISSSAGGQ